MADQPVSTLTTKATPAGADKALIVDSLGAPLKVARVDAIVDERLAGATTKAAPVDADTVPLADSAAAGALKKATLAAVFASVAFLTGLYALLGTYFGVYNALAYVPSNPATDATSGVAALYAAAPAGSTIRFPSRNYILSAGLTVGKSLHLHAAPGATFDVRTPTTSEEKLFYVLASNVTFEGFVFDGTNAPTTPQQTTRHVCIFVGDNTNWYSNVTIARCQFNNLVRKNTTATAGGTAALEAEYGSYFLKVRNSRVIDCTVSELSGCGFFVNASERIWVERNDVAMVSTFQCLYPIHVDTSCDGVWIAHNHVHGGNRRSGGAIDVMSLAGANKRVHILHNTIDGCTGDGSGTSALRFLACEDGSVVGNIIRNITTNQAVYIAVDYRDLPSEQPGPINNLIADNLLICGGTNQRGLDVRNRNTTATGGQNVTVRGNIVADDGTNFFSCGIRCAEIRALRVHGNTVSYKYSAGSSGASVGIEVTAQITGTALFTDDPEVFDNLIDGHDAATTLLLYISGDVRRPRIRGNTLLNWATRGLDIDTTVSDPTFTDNIFISGTSTATAIRNQASGVTTRRGNHLGADALSGLATMTAGTNTVTVTSTEIQAGDMVALVITTSNATDKPVKLYFITGGTSFVIRTVDNSTIATNDMTIRWMIFH